MDINLILEKIKQQVHKEFNNDNEGINPIPICCEDNKLKKSLHFIFRNWQFIR
jgi:hypothetical protein